MPIMIMNDLLFSVAPEVGGERAISGDTQSAVPALAVAEQFGADDALYLIWEAHMQRGLELEEQALEARRSFEEMRKRMLADPRWSKGPPRAS